MPQLSSDQVRHIAKLARLRLSEDEVERFTTELTAILGYIDMLGEVDTSQVEPAKQVTGLSNALREDALWADAPSPGALLETSPLPVVEQQIETPSAHG